MNRTTLRAAAVTALCGLALLLGAAPAFAHTRLLSSDPADGASLDTAPQTVSLTFNEAVPADFATITVVGPDGTAYQDGAVTGGDGVVSTAVRALGPAGRYEVGYRVVSDDGHPITGSLAFTLTAPGPAAATTAPAEPGTGRTSATPVAPAPGASTPASAPADDGGAPVWPWIVGAVVLVGGGVLAALRLGRG